MTNTERDRELEFLRSCVKTADAERDRYKAELEAFKAKAIERAGEVAVTAWILQINRNEWEVPR